MQYFLMILHEHLIKSVNLEKYNILQVKHINDKKGKMYHDNLKNERYFYGEKNLIRNTLNERKTTPFRFRFQVYGSKFDRKRNCKINFLSLFSVSDSVFFFLLFVEF